VLIARVWCSYMLFVVVCVDSVCCSYYIHVLQLKIIYIWN